MLRPIILYGEHYCFETAHKLPYYGYLKADYNGILSSVKFSTHGKFGNSAYCELTKQNFRL